MTTARQPRYEVIAGDLRRGIGRRDYGAGRLLPSESDLSATYEASRVTVRRALEVLRDEGLVASRQGFGWFVTADPLRQRLSRLGTIESQLEADGRSWERRVLDFAFVEPPSEVSAVLGPGQALRVVRLNLADGEPFARVTVWCRDDHAQHLSRADIEREPFYDLLGGELGGATQTIAAAAATAGDAELLEIPSASPVLCCRRTTTDSTGRPVLYSEFVFPALLTEFVVDLGEAEASMAPSGLRLVE